MANLGALAGLFCQAIASLIHVGWSFSAFRLATKYVSLPWFFQPATFSLIGARRSRLKESFWRKYRAIQGRIRALENVPTLLNLLKALGGSGRKNGETIRRGQPKKSHIAVPRRGTAICVILLNKVLSRFWRKVAEIYKVQNFSK